MNKAATETGARNERHAISNEVHSAAPAISAAERPITVQTANSARLETAERLGCSRATARRLPLAGPPPLPDMSHFTKKYCEYCADIAPTVPSLL